MNLGVFGPGYGYVGAVSLAWLARDGHGLAGTSGGPLQDMELDCRDRRLNTSATCPKAGFAFGSSCLPKDLRATAYLAKPHDVDLPMRAGIPPSNRAHVNMAITRIMETGKRLVSMLGLAFEAALADLRAQYVGLTWK